MYAYLFSSPWSRILIDVVGLGKNWYDACKSRALYVDNQRPRRSHPHRLYTISNTPQALRFVLKLQAVILGLPGSYRASTQVTEAACPIELAANHV
jgi:hypothetical protein